MKRTLELTIIRKERVAMEVEFPIYSKHDLKPHDRKSIIYTRLDADMRLVSVHYSCTEDEESYQLEVCAETGPQTGNADYALGRGEFACTAEEFNSSLAAAIRFAESMR